MSSTQPKPSADLAPAMLEARVSAGMTATEPADWARRRAETAATIDTMRARAEFDAADLSQFTKMCATFFACPTLGDPRLLIRVKAAWTDLRRLTTELNAAAERRAADPTAPARGPGGKFLPRGR